ncbi:hypothetical protein, partial [Symbioplanes lichenis]|uniref:hypothetical protein n=1 Tax=Symbioplanes lichenis TaxID=1629072 RepID=UPI002738F25C
MPTVLGNRGSTPFRAAQQTYGFQQVGQPRRINPVVPPRDDTTTDKPAYLATVPVTPGTNLQDLVDKYAAGFTTNPHTGRFGLVIGVNGYRGAYSDQQIADTVAQTINAPFPVTVIGFSWTNREIEQGRPLGQDTIPYAAIRETIVRHPEAENLLGNIRTDDTPTFVHTGDADVDSMAGLFSNADTTIANNDEAQLITGGYQFDANADPMAQHANQRDRAVREAMA